MTTAWVPRRRDFRRICAFSRPGRRAAAAAFVFAVGCAAGGGEGLGLRVGVNDFVETGIPAGMRHLRLGETAAAVAASVFSSSEGVELVLPRETIEKKLTAWELLTGAPENPIEAVEGDADAVVDGDVCVEGNEMVVSAVVRKGGDSRKAEVKGPSGNQETAMALFEELALRVLDGLKQRDPRILVRLGMSLRGQGLVSQAMEKYREAIEIMPEFAAAHYNLGVAYDALGETGSAVVSYRRALEIDPGHVAAGYNLALDELRRRGESETDAEFDARVAQAGRALIKILDANPRAGEARLLLIDSMIIRGRLAEALDEAVRFQRIHADDGRGLEAAGGILLRLGRFGDALAEFRKLNEMEPSLPTAFYFMGMALEGDGRVGEAAECFREFLFRVGMDPRFESAREDVLKRLERLSPAEGEGESRENG